jgi:hypothetical protein
MEEEKKAIATRSVIAWSSGETKAPSMAVMFEKILAGSAIMGWAAGLSLR